MQNMRIKFTGYLTAVASTFTLHQQVENGGGLNTVSEKKKSVCL